MYIGTLVTDVMQQKMTTTITDPSAMEQRHIHLYFVDGAIALPGHAYDVMAV